MNASAVDTCPSRAVVSANPASAGISTARRPRRSLALPAGKRATSSVAVATPSAKPTPVMLSPMEVLVPNSGTSVWKTAPMIHR